MTRPTEMSDTKRILIALGGGLLFSLACLTAAIGPANANATASAPAVSRVALL